MASVAAKQPSKFSAPAEAFAFESDCQFADPQARDKSGLRKMPIEVLARTGRPVYHWYWDWIVHDMAGMVSKERIAFDYRHDPDEPIGFADKITATNELRLAGELISRSNHDAAAKIMDLGPAGVPYEASIHFNPSTMELEWLPEGFQSQVNGQTVNGPLTIVRKWELLRCAICLTGVDGGSQTNFSSGGTSAAQFELKWRNQMGTDPKPDNKTTDSAKESPSGQQSQPATNATGAAATTVSTETNARAQFESEFRNQLNRYVTKFGADAGAKYFAEGKSWEQALESHVLHLEATAKAAVAAQKAAEDKLAKLDLGESTGIDTGAPKGKEPSSTFESMFKPAAGGTLPAAPAAKS